MSRFLPKRIQELPPLESDSEDESEITIKKIAAVTPDTIDCNSSQHSLNLLQIRPKRTSELPPLQSDSEEEDDEYNLNCALHECYEFNSIKENLEDTQSSLNSQEDILQTIVQNENNINILNINEPHLITNINSTNSNEKKDSFITRFSKLKLNSEQIHTRSERSRHSNGTQIHSTDILQIQELTDKLRTKSGLSIFNQFTKNDKIGSKINEEYSIPPFNKCENKRQGTQFLIHSNKEVAPSNISYKCSKSIDFNIERNSQCNSNKVEQNSSEGKLEKSDNIELNAIETQLKPLDINFVTPQIKSFQIPSIRRPISHGMNKPRSILKEEFRTQKVLFTTPNAVSRPPLSLLNDHSIDLSVDDSVKETIPISDNLISKCSPVKEILHVKISASDLFNQSNNSVTECSSSEKLVEINGHDFRIDKKIGSGGSSSVFLAYRKDTKRNCALKIVDLQGDPAIVEGYINETKLLAKLQGNDSVIKLFEYSHVRAENVLYMVMEKGDSDLHKILQTYKTDIPLYTLMTFWHQMLQSVDYIHQNGVIHSDLKPANFLMVNDKLKLIDFGIASNITTDSTSIIKFSQAGTFNYISPEALIDTSTGNSPMAKQNQPKIKISTKSDVWSLGCILYLLLFKKTPFADIKNMYAKVNAITNSSTVIEYPNLPNYYPSMLLEMVQNCLKHNPKERTTVAELLKYPFNMVIPIDT